MLSFGKTNARVLDGNRPRITFEDIAGVDEAKPELATISGYAQLALRRAGQGGPELLALVEALRHIEEAARRVGDLLGELADVQAQYGRHGLNVSKLCPSTYWRVPGPRAHPAGRRAR
jgi:hypothetical protein